MKFFIKHTLKKTGQSLAPDEKFKGQLWRKLEGELAAKTPVSSAWYRHFSVRYAVVVVAAVGIVTCGATGAYAYTSPAVTVGTPLYPLKKTMEKVEGKLKTTPAARAAFLLKTIDRREAEKKVLQQQHREITKINREISATEKQLEKTTAELQETTLEDTTLSEKIRVRLEQRENRLKKKAEELENKKEIVNTEIREASTSTPEEEPVVDGEETNHAEELQLLKKILPPLQKWHEPGEGREGKKRGNVDSALEHLHERRENNMKKE